MNKSEFPSGCFFAYFVLPVFSTAFGVYALFINDKPGHLILAVILLACSGWILYHGASSGLIEYEKENFRRWLDCNDSDGQSNAE